MKRIIIFILVVLTTCVLTQKLKAVDLGAKLLKIHNLEESNYLIETGDFSFLYYNNKDDSFKEYYRGSHRDIIDVIEFKNYIFISDPEYITIVSLEDNSIHQEINEKSIHFFYHDGEKVYGLGIFSLYEINLHKNENTIEYNKIDYLAHLNDPFRKDGKLFYSADLDQIHQYINGQIDTLANLDEYERPEQIYFKNNVLVMEYENEATIYDNKFEYLATVQTDFDYSNYIFNEESYLKRSGTTIIEYSYAGDEIKSYKLELTKNIVSFNVFDMSLIGNDIIIVGDNKTILSVNIENGKNTVLSVFQYSDSYDIGHFEMNDKGLIGYASDKSLFFTSTNNGATWQSHKIEEIYNLKAEYKYVEFIDEENLLFIGDVESSSVIYNPYDKSYEILENLVAGNSNHIPYFNTYKDNYLLVTSSHEDSKGLTSYKIYDNNFELIKNLVLDDVYFCDAASLEDEIICIVDTADNSHSNHLLKYTNFELESVKEIDYPEVIKKPLSVTEFDNKFYLIGITKDSTKSFLFSRDYKAENWEIITDFDGHFVEIFVDNNQLHLKNIDNAYYFVNNSDYKLNEIYNGDNGFAKHFRMMRKNKNLYVSNVFGLNWLSTFDNLDEITTVETQIENQYLAKIFPNPVIDKINIQLSFQQVENLKVEIINIDGKVIRKNSSLEILQINNSEYEVDIKNINAGYYYLHITNNELNELLPFIKK